MVKIKATASAEGTDAIRPENAKAFEELVARYAKQNPVKFAAKKAELDRKLAALKK